MPQKPQIALVAAVAVNGVIGAEGGLPWRLPSDLKRFKAVTLGKPVIMGRKTYESIGRPLPGRRNIVVTRSQTFAAAGIDIAHSLEEAIAMASGEGVGEVCVIGGGELYRQALPEADRLYITHVMAEPQGDTRFPPIHPEAWLPVSSEVIEAGENDSAQMRFVVYEHASSNIQP